MNIALLLLAPFAVTLLNKKEAFKKLEFKPKKLIFNKKETSLKNKVLAMDLDVEIKNPTNTKIDFKSLKADIIYQGTLIATINIGDTTPTGKKVVFDPNKSTALRIPIRAKALGIVTSIINLIDSKKLSQEFEIKGILVAGELLQIPFTQKMKLTDFI